MTQAAAVIVGPTVIQIELPSADDELLPGVRWGRVEAFPHAAYWAYQVLARRLTAGPMDHRLGGTLAEEVGACLLGGHGVPASVGLSAFRHLKAAGVFRGAPSQTEIEKLLRQPIDLEGRSIRYRFAALKARYLAGALQCLSEQAAPQQSGRALRDWLLHIDGIGPKTASWIARNWLGADDVAILDIHVMRAGALGGFLDPRLRVPRDYLQLEAQFVQVSKSMGVRVSELDAVIWQEMMASPRSVGSLLGHRADVSSDQLIVGGRTKVRRANAAKFVRPH